MDSLIKRALYRSGQFFAGLLPVLQPADMAIVEQVLPEPAQRRHFGQMSMRDRRHALAVLAAVRKQGAASPVLEQAAMLHDVGKSAGPLPVHYRVAIVLLEAWAPSLLARLSSGELSSCPPWRRPLVLQRRHPEIGADLALKAGCPPEVVELIRRHQSSPAAMEDTVLREWLLRLQAADDRN
jgi:putative nucleotidyltransferase with HDIG domain